MAAARAKAAVDGGAVGVHEIFRHKRLDGTGKAAALQAPRTAAVEDVLAQRQRQRDALLFGVLDAVGVLVELKAGMPALDDQAQELVKFIVLHSLAQLGGAAAVVVEMDRTHNGAVPHFFAHVGDGGIEVRLRHVAQDLLAKAGGHALHLAADGGVVVGQVGMAALGVADAQHIAVLGQIELGLPDNGVRRVLEIDGDDAAHRARRLVHQAAGFAEKDVLGILADLRDAHLAEFFHIIAVVLAAQDRADAHLKRRRAGKSRPAQHIAGGVGVKTADLSPVVEDADRHAADQRSGMLGLLRLRGADAQVHIADAAKPLRFHADDVVRIGRNDRHDVQVDRTGQHNAVVVVGVVAADLGTAGGRVEAHRAVGAKLLGKMVDRLHVSRALGCQRRVVLAVQFGKSAVIQALCDLLLQFTGVRHNFNSPFLWAALFANMHKKHLVVLGKQPKSRPFTQFLYPV